jgi:POT family proton-dependent oligopeptide transporter
MATAAATTVVPPAAHPRGLYTLFFTEMWERFSYYGMRALLVLFMVDQVQHGGLGFDDQTATAIYGLYTAFVYLASLPGGWLADRLLGAQRAVWYGGIIIALGHFTLALPGLQSFFLGLVFVVLGTGLLKPNISAMVGQLYPPEDVRRDSGFTIFYMGINLGAALGPLICSALGEGKNWHWGFAAAGVGMVFGLIQFRHQAPHLNGVGLQPAHRRAPELGRDPAWYGVAAGVVAVVVLVALCLGGVIHPNPIRLVRHASYGIVAVGTLYFLGILSWGRLTAAERKRCLGLAVLLLASALFWSGFEQAGSSLNLFADRYVNRVLPRLGWVIPAGWFQALNALFIIAFAPVFALLWPALGRRGWRISLPAKFALGLGLLGAGFLVMAFASRGAATGHKVVPVWLISTYLLHTWGELCLSPVGLSAVTRLAPVRFTGQMMGLWFLATSLGNLLAGIMAGETVEDVTRMPAMFLRIVLTTAGVGLLLWVASPLVKRLTGEQAPPAAP